MTRNSPELREKVLAVLGLYPEPVSIRYVEANLVLMGDDADTFDVRDAVAQLEREGHVSFTPRYLIQATSPKRRGTVRGYSAKDLEDALGKLWDLVEERLTDEDRAKLGIDLEGDNSTSAIFDELHMSGSRGFCGIGLGRFGGHAVGDD